MEYKIQGKLIRASTKRWAIQDAEDQRWEVCSGDVIELLIGNTWVRTRIEFGIGDYYAVVPGVKLQSGLEARQ